VWLYQLGEGRVVVISGSPARGYETVSTSLGDWQAEGRWMWIPGWEYGFGLFSKSIIWAGKKDSGILIKEIKGSSEKVECVIENQISKDIEINYEFKIRNAFYEVEEEKTGKIILKSGENKIEFKIEKPLTDKIHIIDLILKDAKGKSYEWASCKFNISKDISLNAKMEKDTSAYRENEEIKGIIIVENKGEKRNLKLDIEVEDAYKRIVYKEQKNLEINSGKNEIVVNIDKSKVLDIWHEFKVSLLDGQTVLSKDRHIFFIYPDRMPVYNDFYLACWGNLEPDPLKIIIAGDKLKEAGIDYVYSYGAGKSERYVAYKTHHLLIGPPFSCSLKGGYFGNRKADTKNLTYDPPLVPSEEEIAKFRERMKNLAKEYSEWGGADYIHLDDERDMQQDYDWSERTINKFREWLKERYKTIQALNKQWETKYNDWNEVMPVRIEDIKDKDNLSQYIDWRTFIGWAIMEYYYKLPAEAAKEGNPRAVVGQHGIYQTGLTIPQDFYIMSKYTPVTGRYNGMIEEWFSSFGVISGQYGGYGVEKATPRHRYHPWRSLFHGGHWAFYYILWNAGTHHQGILSPDQTVHGGYNELSKEEFSDIKKGIGKLFIETDFSHDGICFPYSYSSILVSQVIGLSRTGNLYSQKTLIENLGYQHRTLSYEQIKNGELKNFKVLILPSTISLSLEEINAIKEFVKNGGVVIADYQTGVRDEHGKVYGKQSPLDEIFGIDRTNAELIRIKKNMKFLKDSIFGEKEIQLNIAETGLKLKTGKNMAIFEDGTPALIFNNYGKGKGIYLNIEISDYAGMKGKGVAGEIIEEEKGAIDYVKTIQDIFEEIIKSIGIKKRVEIYEGEKQVNSGERFYYKDRENLYFGYIPEVNKETKVKFKIEKKAHIYDLRNKKYLGYTDSFEDTLIPGNVKVYSILPYRVIGIYGNLKSEYKAGENIELELNLNTDTKKAGKHIIRMEIYKDGKNIEGYNKNIVAENGKLKYIIPFAYNEKGNYELLVRDINSGVEKIFKLKVK
ncbi:MAG: beta-galactosidase, partial [Candidatus Omnitrophica bacterium]|nr:beta-galactosidase [Candidatus Omnitrophota bacterium]